MLASKSSALPSEPLSPATQVSPQSSCADLPAPVTDADEKHAGRCVEIEPSYRKGWLRLGAACLRLHDASIARGAAERGLAQQSDTTDDTAVTKQLKGKSKISLNHSSCRPCQANLPPTDVC